MRWPLRNQILLPMAAAMLGTLFGVSILNAYLSAQNTKSQIHEQLRDVANTLYRANFPLTNAVLQQTRGLSGAEFAVVDHRRRIISSSRDQLSLPDSSHTPQSGEELTLIEIVTIENTPYFYAVVDLPRQSSSSKTSSLHIFYPEERYRQAIWNAVLPQLYVGGIALVLVFVLAIVIAGRVTRPLDRLRTQVGRISQGQFQPMQLSRRNDEVLDLGKSINRMAEMLAQYENEVRKNERLRTLGQLSGSMAHQLRNAATGCRMALDLHRRACPCSVDDETLTVALRQLSLMERYLQHFFSRGDTPARPHDVVDLVAIANDVLELVRPNAEHVGVHVELVPTAGPLQVKGNAEDLGQLIINLVLNAIDASAKPEENIGSQPYKNHVCICIAPTIDDNVVIEVQDSGAGPDESTGNAIFEPLVTGKIDGTGLGLSVAQEIAAQHKSIIRWERRDQLTCFSLELPLSNVERACVDIADC